MESDLYLTTVDQTWLFDEIRENHPLPQFFFLVADQSSKVSNVLFTRYSSSWSRILAAANQNISGQTRIKVVANSSWFAGFVYNVHVYVWCCSDVFSLLDTIFLYRAFININWHFKIKSKKLYSVYPLLSFFYD